MDWSLIEAPAAASQESGFSFGSFFKQAGDYLKETGWDETLNDSLQKGVSRWVDAETSSQFQVNDAPPLFANENGQRGVAGRASTNPLTAPTITVVGKAVSPMMLAGGAAAVLLVLFLVMRR